MGNILNNSGINNEIAYYYGKKPNHAPLKITSPYPLWSVPSTINFCKTIIYPNRVYYLGKNISSAGTCINITANNVTLDGQGYTINYGIKNSGNGVYSQNRNYLLIRNMSIYLNNVSRRSSPGIDFENSSYDNLTSLKIFIKGDSMTSGSHCEGINLVTVTNSYIDKCFINTTNTRDSDGIRMTTSGSYDGPIANNKITNSEVYVYGDGSSGLKMIDYRNDRILDILVDKSKFYSKSYSCIYLQGNSIKSNNFNMNNTLVQSNYYGISITNADNNLISNSNISNITISSSDQNILLNTSYLSEGVSSGTLIRKWYFNAQVNYSNGTFVNQANVTAWNISGNWQFSELTDSSGQISQKELIEYVNNGAAKIYYTNYTINATKNGIVAQQSFNLTGNLNLLLTLDLLELNDTHKYYHKDSLGNAVAWLGNKGNIVLKGKCFSGGTCNNPGDGSLIFRNESNYNLGFINITGDLCITKGDCSDESSNCNSPADGAFIIANSTSYVSYIDGEGDLCLTGKLYESSSP